MQIMDQNLIRASQEAGFCSRIRYNALPYNLTLLSTGFIQIWLVGGPQRDSGLGCILAGQYEERAGQADRQQRSSRSVWLPCRL